MSTIGDQGSTEDKNTNKEVGLEGDTLAKRRSTTDISFNLTVSRCFLELCFSYFPERALQGREITSAKTLRS